MAVSFQSKAIIGLLITFRIAIDYRYRKFNGKVNTGHRINVAKKCIFPTLQTTKPQVGLYTTNDIR